MFELIDQLQAYLSEYGLWIGIGLLAALLLSVALCFIAFRYAKAMKLRWKQSVLLSHKLEPDNGLEQNLNDLLELVAEQVDAPTYVFYLYDESKQGYLMKAVRHRSQDFGKVEPSYSGLVEYKKEQYLPPLSLSVQEAPERAEIRKAGEVKLLSVPIGSKRGLIRIGPVKMRKLNKKTQRFFDDFTEMMQHALKQFLSMEEIRNKANVIVSTGEALQRINNIARDSKVTVDFVLKLAMKVMGASGAVFGIKQDDLYQLTQASGSGDESLNLNGVSPAKAGADVFALLSGQEQVRLITASDDAYFELPPYFAATGAEAFTAVDVSERREEPASRILMLWFKTEPKREEWPEMEKSLQLLADHMREILGYQLTLSQFSGSYVHILKTLAVLQDNLVPHTVGYSELMSRYSIVIAKEMGLEEDVIRDVALAAYLSNIGVMGISADLVNKEGKFSDDEFERMKLHAEVGASIVESTLGNARVASYIMHHHERMDGNGYPAGLKGNEIPVGARIIGVVQTFLAVINGRKYRDPLPFHKALLTLTAAGGSQLDPDIVNKFIAWFKSKQEDPQLNGRSLGVCWEMCCTPSSICENCPAYRRTDKNCWEFETNNCKAHGKSCATCYVRTELAARKEHAYQ